MAQRGHLPEPSAAISRRRPVIDRNRGSGRGVLRVSLSTEPGRSAVPNEMVCPKCRGTMSSYERNGVVVDQCQDCRGIFLDRGELERLVDAEGAYHRTPPAQQRDDGRPYASRGYQEGYRPKRKRSFLEELFD
jgi:uncharacterized protein